MSDGIASPFSTGAGGSAFEAKVQAAFLLGLISGVPLPCLPTSQGVSLRFQARQAGFHTDDVVAIAVDARGIEHKLLCQIKHQITFTKSSDNFREVIINAWHDYSTLGVLNRSLDAIAFITGPQTARTVNDIRPVLEWARHCNSGGEFIEKIETANFSSKGKRAFVTDVREIIDNVLEENVHDDELWAFLKILHVISYDFDIQYSQDEARAIRLIDMIRHPSSMETAVGLWSQIIDCARGYNQNAGCIHKGSLGDLLPTGLRAGLLASPAVYGSPSVTRLTEHTELTLRLVTDEFVSGVTVLREDLLNQAIEALYASRFIVLTSEAGGGKSALAKQILDRLSPEGPKFVFRVEEFDHPHLHQALTAIGIDESIADLSVRFGLLPQRILLIEGVERLLEMDHQQAFHQLLAAVAGDGQWRVILTCRTHAANWLITHVLTGGSLQPLAVQVPRLSRREVAQVAQQVPSIQSYLENRSIAEVLRTPFYLRIACHAGPGIISHPATAVPTAIRRTLWQAAVQNPNRSRGGLPVRRERAFIDLAVRRAKLMQPYITAEGGDDEAVNALIADGVVDQAGDGRLAPAHDLFEDWAVEAHVARCFEQAAGDPARLFELLGPEPALRRAFRHWLGSELLGQEAPRVADLVISACRNAEIPQHWRDEVLVGVLLSPDAETLLRRLETGLLVDQKALLIRAIHLLRTACKGPNLSLFQQMGISDHVRDQLGLHFTRPIGPGWEATISLVHRYLGDFGLAEAGVLEGLLADWCGAIDVNNPPLDPAEKSADIALRYIAMLTKSESWHRGLDDKFIDILMKIPGARPQEVTALFSSAINDSEESHFSRTLIEKGVASITCYALCRHLPYVAIAVADSYARPRRRRRNGRFIADDDDFTTGLEAAFGLGRTFGLRLHPASALTGPFLHLLSQHPKLALEFVLRLCNNAVDAYAGSRFGDECYTVLLKVEGKEPRPIIASDRLWCLYRGTSVGPHYLAAALMALESTLLLRAAAGEDLSEDAALILRSTNSVTFVAVLASVAIAHPDALEAISLPLVSTIEFFRLDKVRMVRDLSHTTDLRPMLGIPTGGLEDIYYDERKKADAAPHRKEELESLAVKLQFGGLRPKVRAAIDAMRSDSEGNGDEETNTLDRLLFKRIDVREWEVVEHKQYGTIIAPRVEEPELQAVISESQANQQVVERWLRLHNWAIAIFTRKGDGGGAFESWQEALSEAIALHSQAGEPSAEDFFQHLGVFAAVASVVVRDHGPMLDSLQVIWCVDRIEEGIAANIDDPGPMVSHQRHASHGSRPAAFVAPLLLGLVCPDTAAFDRVRRMIAAALTHAVDEVATYAASGVQSHLWKLAPSFAQQCFEVLLWLARSNGIMIRRTFGDSKAYYTERLRLAQEARCRMLVNGHEPNVPASINLTTVSTRELLRALWSVADASRDWPYVQLLTRAINQLALAVEKERNDRDSRERITHDFEFRHYLSALYAETFFVCPPENALAMSDTLLAAIERAPEVVGEILQQVLYEADRRNAYDRFWMIWKPVADRVLGRDAPRRRGRGRYGDLVEIILFATTSWKKGVKTWEPLESNREFILSAFAQVGHTGSGFAALVSLLRTVGGFLLPDAIVDLNEARKRSSYDVIEEVEIRRELELLLRDTIFAYGSTVRCREPLRQACLDLFDELVNRGSSLAFQLREILISPGRRRLYQD